MGSGCYGVEGGEEGGGAGLLEARFEEVGGLEEEGGEGPCGEGGEEVEC